MLARPTPDEMDVEVSEREVILVDLPLVDSNVEQFECSQYVHDLTVRRGQTTLPVLSVGSESS